MQFATIQEFFNHIATQFDPSKTQGQDKCIQLKLTGDQGGDWYIAVQGNALTVEQGLQSSPDVTMTLSAQDWLDIVNKQVQPPVLFMTGALKIDGDLKTAIDMASWFE